MKLKNIINIPIKGWKNLWEANKVFASYVAVAAFVIPNAYIHKTTIENKVEQAQIQADTNNNGKIDALEAMDVYRTLDLTKKEYIQKIDFDVKLEFVAEGLYEGMKNNGIENLSGKKQIEGILDNILIKKYDYGHTAYYLTNVTKESALSGCIRYRTSASEDVKLKLETASKDGTCDMVKNTLKMFVPFTNPIEGSELDIYLKSR